MGRGTRGMGRGDVGTWDVGTWGRGRGDAQNTNLKYNTYFVIASLGNMKIRNGTLKYIT